MAKVTITSAAVSDDGVDLILDGYTENPGHTFTLTNTMNGHCFLQLDRRVKVHGTLDQFTIYLATLDENSALPRYPYEAPGYRGPRGKELAQRIKKKHSDE